MARGAAFILSLRYTIHCVGAVAGVADVSTLKLRNGNPTSAKPGVWGAAALHVSSPTVVSTKFSSALSWKLVHAPCTQGITRLHSGNFYANKMNHHVAKIDLMWKLCALAQLSRQTSHVRTSAAGLAALPPRASRPGIAW